MAASDFDNEKDILRREFEVIRDENRAGANTALRVGKAFLDLLDFLSMLIGKFIRKDVDDTVAGHITFSNGLTSEGEATFKDDVVVEGETLLKKVVTIGDFEKDVVAGVGSSKGIQMDPNGRIIARSLELSEYLSVPTLKYNSNHRRCHPLLHVHP